MGRVGNNRGTTPASRRNAVRSEGEVVILLFTSSQTLRSQTTWP